MSYDFPDDYDWGSIRLKRFPPRSSCNIKALKYVKQGSGGKEASHYVSFELMTFLVFSYFADAWLVSEGSEPENLDDPNMPTVYEVVQWIQYINEDSNLVKKLASSNRFVNAKANKDNDRFADAKLCMLMDPELYQRMHDAEGNFGTFAYDVDSSGNLTLANKSAPSRKSLMARAYLQCLIFHNAAGSFGGEKGAPFLEHIVSLYRNLDFGDGQLFEEYFAERIGDGNIAFGYTQELDDDGSVAYYEEMWQEALNKHELVEKKLSDYMY